MKKLRNFILMIVLAVFATTATGCFGQFELTRKVYQWNDEISDNNFVKTLVFYGLSIIPIYGVAGFLDLCIFNLIEFWTGSNPIAMADGDYEEQIVEHGGKSYKLSATKNKLSVYEINEEELNFLYTVMYCEGSSEIALQTEQSQFAVAHVE